MSENDLKYTEKIMEFVQRSNALGIMGETAEEKSEWIETMSKLFDSIPEYLATISHCGIVSTMSYSGLSYDKDALNEAHIKMERAEQMRRDAHIRMIGSIKLIENATRECGMEKFFDVSYNFDVTTNFFKEGTNEVLVMRDELSEEVAKFVGEMMNNAEIITFDDLLKSYENDQLESLQTEISDKMQETSDKYDDFIR